MTDLVQPVRGAQTTGTGAKDNNFQGFIRTFQYFECGGTRELRRLHIRTYRAWSQRPDTPSEDENKKLILLLKKEPAQGLAQY